MNHYTDNGLYAKGENKREEKKIQYKGSSNNNNEDKYNDTTLVSTEYEDT